jgi:GNAT superfamily N-acetyltransferase
MVTLAPVTADNAETFKAVRLRALADAPNAFGSTYAREAQFTHAEWLARIERWNGVRGIGFLAMDAGEGCGIAGGLLAEDDAPRATLVSMWTAATHRQSGVGRLLVDAVANWARLRGVRALNLTVVSTNEAAIRFYRRLGFAMTGRTDPYPNDPALLEYEMTRELCP